MAEKVFDIGVGTGIDQSGLEKGLNELQKKIIEETAKLTQETEKAANEQIKIIQKTEKEKVEEVKKGIQEQIASIKAMPIGKAEMQERINAAKEVADAEVKFIKEKANLSSNMIKNMAKDQIKTYKDLAAKQVKALKDGNKKSLQSIKEFSKSAIQELLGIDQVLSTLAGGPAAVGKAFIQGGKQIVSTLNDWSMQAAEAARTIDTLNAVLKSTGASSWITTTQLQKLAKEQSNATGVSRNEIIQAQTALLGYTNITKDVFNDTTKAALDMARVTRTDVKSAMETLGKALDVPSQGLTALTKQGFRFTDQQKEMIVELEKTNRTVEAQRIILEQVQSTYDEAGTAINPAIQAQIKFTNAVEDFTKAIGERASPIIEWYKTGIAGILNLMTESMDRAKDVKDAAAFLSQMNKKQMELIGAEERELRSLQNRRDAATGAERENYDDLIQRQKDKIEQMEIDAVLERRYTTQSLTLMQERLRILNLMGIHAKQVGEAWIPALAGEQAALAKALGIKDVHDLQRELLQATEAIDTIQNNLKPIEGSTSTISSYVSTTVDRRTEIVNSLAKEKAGIIAIAELEGKSVENIEVRKKLLDAELQAYGSLVSEGLASLTDKDKYKEARQGHIDITDAIKLQEEALIELDKIYKEIKEEVQRQDDLAAEEEYQNKLTEIRKRSIKAAIDFETEETRKKLDELYVQKEEDLEKTYRLIEANLDKQYDAEREAAKENNDLLLEIAESYIAEKLRMEEEYTSAVINLSENRKAEEIRLNRESIEAQKQADKELLEDRLKNANEYLSAAGQIGSNIASIWKNNIDFEIEAKLRANDKLIQSDEERAAAEERILKEGAYEKYKAELFAWGTNVTMATADASMAVLKALSSTTPPASYVMAALATVMGGMQVAAVMSARPKPPRFHTGGQVSGRSGQEVFTNLQSGEYVTTNKQFKNIMQSFENMANMKTAAANPSLTVNVENNAADMVSTTQSMDTDGLRLVIEKVTAEALRSGRLDDSLAAQQQGLQGVALM